MVSFIVTYSLYITTWNLLNSKQITPQIHMYSLFLLRGINIGFKGNETN